jgi:hypothetical protein
MNILDFIKIVKPYTMTSEERITALYNTLEYIRINNIPGDIVECGVWKGGNILGCIEYMNFYKMDKEVWLYDTFNGMTGTTDIDVDMNGVPGELWKGLCNSPLFEVQSIMNQSSYNKDKLHYVVGDILETLDNISNIPKSISLLRLDTDWYASTKKEMEILYPILSQNGVLIVDDYGHWKGAKKAIDEYFINQNINIENIDYTGIKIIKYGL